MRPQTFFIDHANLFGGPDGKLPIKSTLQCWVSRSSNLYWPFIEATAEVSADCARSGCGVPENWKTKSGLDNFCRTLHRLSSSAYLRELLD
jgi:hypothetical protein